MAVANMVWFARHANVAVANVLSSVSTSAELYGQVSGGTSPQVMTEYAENIEVTGANMDVEVINTLGAAQKVNEKRPELRKVKMDLVYSDSTKMLLQRLMGSSMTITVSGFTRFNGGDKTTKASHRLKCALAVQFNDNDTVAPAKVNCLLNNAYLTGYEGPKIAGDDYGKITIEVSCLAQDYYEEDNLSDS